MTLIHSEDFPFEINFFPDLKIDYILFFLVLKKLPKIYLLKSGNARVGIEKRLIFFGLSLSDYRFVPDSMKNKLKDDAYSNL